MTGGILLLAAIIAVSTLCSYAFTPYSSVRLHANKYSNRVLTLRESSEPSTATVDTSDKIIPTYLPSDKGVDYIPLATMLATGDFLGADDFTRNNLIKIAGAEEAGRAFVYWTEVKKIPSTDLATMERLWLHFSDGKFGYSVQSRLWKAEKENFDNFIRRIGWTIADGSEERKRKWFGANEFMYNLETAPRGHLPLTSALRGTQLLKELMKHPVWQQYDWKNYKDLKWGP